MLRELFSLCLSILMLIAIVFILISVSSVATSAQTLQKYSWIEAESDGTVMAAGKIYGGTNAIYITGEDSDVLKYIDCKDLFDFCQTCGSISSSTTFLISITFLFAFISLCLTWSSICYKSNELRRSVSSALTCLTGIIAYANFGQHCENGFQKSDGVTGVKFSFGYDSLLYGILICGVVGLSSGIIKLIEEKTTWLSSRTTTVYATNQDFEFNDVENDPEFQANLD
jgi:hypothetical protein